jgi:hypothetical protein
MVNKFPKPPEFESIAKEWNVDKYDVFFDLDVRTIFVSLVNICISWRFLDLVFWSTHG